MCRPDGRPGSRHWARHRAITGACGTVGYCGCACSTCWVGRRRERGPDEGGGEGRMRAVGRMRAGRGRGVRPAWDVCPGARGMRDDAPLRRGRVLRWRLATRRRPAARPAAPARRGPRRHTAPASVGLKHASTTCMHTGRADAGVGVGLVARRKGLVEGVKQRTKQRGRDRSQGQRHGRHERERRRRRRRPVKPRASTRERERESYNERGGREGYRP